MRIFKREHFALDCFGPDIPRKDNRVPDIENSIEIAHTHTHTPKSQLRYIFSNCSIFPVYLVHLGYCWNQCDQR